MTDDDLEFYQMRANQEREAEASSDSAEAASAHRLLALEYEAQIEQMRPRQPPRKRLSRRSD